MVGVMEFMVFGLSHEVNLAAVLSKVDALFDFMGVLSFRAYDTPFISGMKIVLSYLGICWTQGTLGIKVTSATASTAGIKLWIAEGCVVLVIWDLCHLEDWSLLVYEMEADSSIASVQVPPSVDKKLKEVKQELNSLQAQVTTIDYEGGRRLDHVSKDLFFLKKKIQRKVKRIENSLSRKLIELELKVDKLVLKFLNHEENGMSSSSEG